MKGVFVDTAGWMACADAGDPAHKPSCGARDTALEQGRILVTTDYVIALYIHKRIEKAIDALEDL